MHLTSRGQQARIWKWVRRVARVRKPLPPPTRAAAAAAAGTVVVYGTSTNKVDRFPYVPLMHKDLALRGFWLWHWLKGPAAGLGGGEERIGAGVLG